MLLRIDMFSKLKTDHALVAAFKVILSSGRKPEKITGSTVIAGWVTICVDCYPDIAQVEN